MHKPLIALVLLGAAAPALAGEVRIGEAVQANGLEIQAVYLQPVLMEPRMPGMLPADVHLEADIAAGANNQHGFAPGSWVPYLGISYHLSKIGDDWSASGRLAPMVASDGPHYAANVSLAGAGKYRLRYRIDPPPYQGFLRHDDKETGVAPWWEPFDVEWTFVYVGTGKKGGY